MNGIRTWYRTRIMRTKKKDHMKNLTLFGTLALLIALGLQSCKEPDNIQAGFEDAIGMTIYDYIISDSSSYSSFLQVIEAGELDLTLSAYNPDGDGYTLFLPDNPAMDEYIALNKDFNSLEDMLADKMFSKAFSRYHVVNMKLKADDFPFGAIQEKTLSGDRLTVSFVIESDTSFYMINNQAPVTLPDVEVSNGWVHEIGAALLPVTLTTLEWLQESDDYSIFTDAVELTGFGPVLDVDIKEEEDAQAVTLFLEHDSVFAKRGINSVEDLIDFLEPNDTDYTSSENTFNGFVGYHILEESMFLDDFSENLSNYTTFSSVPVLVDGEQLDLKINPEKEVFDTIFSGEDTILIDYVLFDIDNSNVLTKSGAIHFIDQILQQQEPSIARQRFEFYDEPLISEYRETPGEYLIQDTASLRRVRWSGADLMFVETQDDTHPAWGGDYFLMNGDFSFRYHLPKMVQGTYIAKIRANGVDEDNALVEVFIDGQSIGGLVDLSRGTGWAFKMIELGTINFLQYEEHVMEIRSLVPGSFELDFIEFEPYEDFF